MISKRSRGKKNFDLIDFGNRCYLYKENGVILRRAILSLLVQFMEEKVCRPGDIEPRIFLQANEEVVKNNVFDAIAEMALDPAEVLLHALAFTGLGLKGVEMPFQVV